MTAVPPSLKFVRTVIAAFTLLGGIATIGKAQDASVAPDQFHVGDRIALTIQSPVYLSDTVVVRDGFIVQLPNIGELSVKGVRRSDAQKHLTQEVGRFLKNPVLVATPLVQVSVLGPVGRPGFYAVPMDTKLSDVVMRAGGPATNADIDKTVIKRSGKDMLGKSDVSAALASGKTLDDLRLTSGDQIVVGEKSSRSLASVLQFGSLLLGIVGVAVTLAR